MAVYKIARYRIRPDAADDAERAMHDFAAYVRKELPRSTWTVYRDPADPAHYLAMSRSDDRASDAKHRDAPGTRAFDAAVAPLLEGEPEVREYALVTSSDLAPRHRPERIPSTRRGR